MLGRVKVPSRFLSSGESSKMVATVSVLLGDSTGVRVSSSTGDSSSNQRPLAKASAPFVQG